MASKKKKPKKNKKVSPQKRLKQEKVEAKNGKRYNSKYLLTAFAILLITFIAFYTSLDNGFVNWDDDKNFYENELITSLNDNNFWENTKEIFTSTVIGGYNPLTIWTFALDQKFHTLEKPFYWHLENVLLHLVCTFFVFWIGLRLKLGYFGAIILALLFGIHPMRVESVAWVTERKDVLFGAFYLAAMYYYICGKQDGFKIKHFVIIGLCFTLSLLSKIQAVIFPISMILVDYYLSKDSRIKINDIITKVPLFIGSMIIGVLGIKYLDAQGSITDQEYTGIDRLFIGSYSLAVYYIKALVPFRLSPLYPYPATLDWSFFASILSFIVTGGILALSYLKKYKTLFFGLGFFLANIVLLLQIIGAGQGFLADRFTYIPYFGLFFIFAYYLNQIITKKEKLKIPILTLVGVVLMGYAYQTFNQNKIWKDSGTLWTHVLKYYKKSTLPWGNRANHYRDNGNVQQALFDYNKVIRLKPDRATAYNSLARLYFNYSERDSLLKALYNYNKAIELEPEVEYVVNRGATYAKLGDMENALVNLNQAEKIDPTWGNIYLNRSVIYNQRKDYVNALSDIDKYLALKPNNPDMWYEKCRLHNAIGDYQSGLAAVEKALLMKKSGIYYFERAKCKFVLQQFEQAKADIRQAQALNYNGDPGVINKILNGQ